MRPARVLLVVVALFALFALPARARSQGAPNPYVFGVTVRAELPSLVVLAPAEIAPAVRVRGLGVVTIDD